MSEQFKSDVKEILEKGLPEKRTKEEIFKKYEIESDKILGDLLSGKIKYDECKESLEQTQDFVKNLPLFQRKVS